jgi:hypothetical protein
MHAQQIDSSRHRFELQQQFLAMPEHKLLMELDGLQMSIWLFEQNYIELKAIVAQIVHAQQSMQLTTPNNRMLFDAFIYELTRRLHNFTASAASLLNHTERLYKRHYKKKGLFPEYETKLKTHFAWPVARFVEGLRDYMAHFRLPGIALETRILDFGIERMSHQLTIPKKSLLEYRWEPDVKKFIETYADKSIDIWHAVDNYHRHVLKFYEWFATKQREIHRKEYAMVSRAQEELLALMAPEVPNAIRERLKFLSKGLGTPVNVLGVYLTREQDAEIAPLLGKPVDWTEAALQRIQKIVSLPPELLDSIKRSVRPQAA